MKDLSQKIEIREDGSLNVMTINKEPTLTQQQFAEECDINNIMAKYQKTGEFLHKTSKIGQYSDFSTITDYQDMLETVKYAQEAFNTLPAAVRQKFQNDPAQLLNFVQDDKNYDEALSLGILEPSKQKQNNQPTTPNEQIKINEQSQNQNPNQNS